MAASDGSFVGIAKQTGKGTPNATDASFKYLLFNEGGIAPSNMTVPLDTEVGGGAMLRDVQKMGVMTRRAVRLRPASLRPWDCCCWARSVRSTRPPAPAPTTPTPSPCPRTSSRLPTTPSAPPRPTCGASSSRTAASPAWP